MPESERRIIVVPDVIRTGVWPGGAMLCIRAETRAAEIGMWLRDEAGQYREMAPYRHGMKVPKR